MKNRYWITVYSVLEEGYVVSAKSREAAVTSLKNEHHEPIYSEHLGVAPEKDWEIVEFKGEWPKQSVAVPFSPEDWAPFFDSASL